MQTMRIERINKINVLILLKTFKNYNTPIHQIGCISQNLCRNNPFR